MPEVASAWSFVAAFPRATSTAVPGWIRTAELAAADGTGTAMSVFGVAGGNDPRTAANAPGMRGVVVPQSSVKSEMPFVPGALFRYVSARRCPVPRQVPRNPTLRTSSSPSSVIPALERAAFGGVARTPSCRRMPLGRPSDGEK